MIRPGRSSTSVSLARAGVLLFGCLLLANAGAHLLLTAETLDDALARIGELHTLIGEQGDRADDQEALYLLGDAAWQLAELMNEEVRVHGLEQQALMTEGTERAKAFGVEITWSEDHQRFFYDGDAYHRYLLRAPDGPFAADSRYRLIELDFYRAAADNIAALEDKAKNKREFLEAYPDFPAKARVNIFLGIDYRDLYRLCLAADDVDCEETYARLAIEQFRKVASGYADSDSGEIAAQLLVRTQSEIDAQPR